ncbi:Uncharacterised protein [Mycobacteroides abscessus subsp. massiliense]|nr:Uncharacterised protein [Mycobacteroides abscessus subsp. massiliense]
MINAGQPHQHVAQNRQTSEKDQHDDRRRNTDADDADQHPQQGVRGDCQADGGQRITAGHTPRRPVDQHPKKHGTHGRDNQRLQDQTHVLIGEKGQDRPAILHKLDKTHKSAGASVENRYRHPLSPGTANPPYVNDGPGGYFSHT